MPKKKTDPPLDQPEIAELQEEELDDVQGGAAFEPVELRASMKHEIREHVSLTDDKLGRTE